MSQSIKVAIVGAAGRMGLALLEHAHALEDMEVVAAIDSPGGDALGRRLGPDQVPVTGDLAEHIAQCDVVVDFSTPEAAVRAVRMAAGAGCAFVSGTTGLTASQQAVFDTCAQSIPVLQAANFSVGVNVLERLVELASRATGDAFDLEVFEAHHRRKVDAPSGTALFLGEAAARGRDTTLEASAQWTRHGQVGPRQDGEIGFQVVRGGDIVGEHTVFVCGAGERLELTHRATDRGIFAQGALRAALWLHARRAGVYTMGDVLFSSPS